MAEKRYYWMKLKDDFFTSKRIKRLRNLAGGDTYTIIYLKMQLKSLKDGGRLYFDGVMDNFADELALDIDEKPDDVRVTVSYLLSVGLLETDDESTYNLTYLENLIGSETSHTQRQRDYIQRKKAREASFCDAQVTQMLRSCDADIEIEKEIDIEIENPPISPPKRRKQKKTASDFVPPTLEEVTAYARERNSPVDPNKFWTFFHEGNWIDTNGKPVLSWKQKFLTWEQYGGKRKSVRERAKAPEEYDRKGDFFEDEQ